MLMTGIKKLLSGGVLEVNNTSNQVCHIHKPWRAAALCISAFSPILCRVVAIQVLGVLIVQITLEHFNFHTLEQ